MSLQKKTKAKVEKFKSTHQNIIIRCPKCHIALQSIHINRNGLWLCPSCKAITDYNKARLTKKKSSKGGGKRRKLPNDMVIDHDAIIDFLNIKFPDGIENYQMNSRTLKKTYRQIALAALLYISGKRISEIVGKREKGKYIIKPLMRNQISIDTEDDGEKAIIISNVSILKTRAKLINTGHELIKDYPKQTIKLPYSYDGKLFEFLWKYIKDMDRIRSTNYILFPITRVSAWRYIQEIFDKKIYTHWLRHSRFTSITKDMGFNELQLRQFAGWTTTRMATSYVHLDEDILYRSMKQRVTKST